MPIAASRSDSGTSPAVGAASAVPSSSPPSPRHSIGTRYCRRPTNGCVPPASTTPSPRSLAHESWSPSPTPSSPGTRRGSQNHPPTAPTLNRRNRNEKHGCFFGPRRFLVRPQVRAVEEGHAERDAALLHKL